MADYNSDPDNEDPGQTVQTKARANMSASEMRERAQTKIELISKMIPQNEVPQSMQAAHEKATGK